MGRAFPQRIEEDDRPDRWGQIRTVISLTVVGSIALGIISVVMIVILSAVMWALGLLVMHWNSLQVLWGACR